MRHLGRVVGISLCLTVGCTFNSQGEPGDGLGLGDDDDDGDGPADDPSGQPTTASGTAAPSSGEPPPDEDDAGDPSTTSGNSGDDADDSADDGNDSADDGNDSADEGDTGNDTGADTGEPIDCDAPFDEIWWAEDADVTMPMDLMEASSAIGNPLVAASGDPEEGVVVFDVDLPCAGEYYAWGLVWDFEPGPYAPGDPDSFYVSPGGPEFIWRYGCQTDAVVNALSWQPLQSLVDQPCDVSDILFEVEEGGTHQLHFRNREAGSAPGIAAIGAIVMSTDPDFDPYSLYEPY